MANVNEFVDDIARQAIAARDSGDLATVERLSAHPAMRDYINNVVFLGAMDRTQFGFWHKDKWSAIVHLAESYEEAQQESARIDSVESKLDRLAELVEQLIGVQTSKQQAQIAESDEKQDDTADENETTEAEETATPADVTASEGAADESDEENTEDDA